MIVASPNYLETHGEPRVPADIAAHQTIHFGGFDPATEWPFVEDGRDTRVGCTPRYITDSADTALFHAEHGGGLARVLAYQAADALRTGRLVPVLRSFEPPPLPIHLVYPTARLLSAKVRAFIELVTETSDWNFSRR
jgi:DNA-binding transcriptional LysR family regulator